MKITILTFGRDAFDTLRSLILERGTPLTESGFYHGHQFTNMVAWQDQEEFLEVTAEDGGQPATIYIVHADTAKDLIAEMESGALNEE